MLGERMDVFEKTPPHCLYLPNGAEWKAMAETDCVIAVCSAPGKGGHEARRIGPEGITLTARGKGANTRHINNIAMEDEDFCDSLLVTEVFTPAGHWSSYPSHRHDEDDFPRITYLEETYYHRLNPRDGFGDPAGLHRRRNAGRDDGGQGRRCRACAPGPPSMRRAPWVRDVLPECHGGSPAEVALRARPGGRVDHEAGRLSRASQARRPPWTLH